MKKIPPYGKPLDLLIKSGCRPLHSINLFIGQHAWEKGKYFSESYPTRTLILPAWLGAYVYFWPVRGCDVLIHDTGYASDHYVDEIASELYQHEAGIVRFVDCDKKIIVYHKE